MVLEITFLSLDFHELWHSVMSICLFTEVAMGYVSTGMGDRFSALFTSLMALRLAVVDPNPFGLVLPLSCSRFLGKSLYSLRHCLMYLYFHWTKVYFCPGHHISASFCLQLMVIVQNKLTVVHTFLVNNPCIFIAKSKLLSTLLSEKMFESWKSVYIELFNHTL